MQECKKIIKENGAEQHDSRPNCVTGARHHRSSNKGSRQRRLPGEGASHKARCRVCPPFPRPAQWRPLTTPSSSSPRAAVPAAAAGGRCRSRRSHTKRVQARRGGHGAQAGPGPGRAAPAAPHRRNAAPTTGTTHPRGGGPAAAPGRRTALTAQRPSAPQQAAQGGRWGLPRRELGQQRQGARSGAPREDSRPSLPPSLPQELRRAPPPGNGAAFPLLVPHLLV